MIRAGHAKAALAAAATLIAFNGHAADIARGAEVYRQHCARCHGVSGLSTWPGAPQLARREGLMQADSSLLQYLRRGRGAKPGYQGLLSDAALLSVIAYSRTLAR
jgi:mono/diheme cytochrome c family protein